MTDFHVCTEKGCVRTFSDRDLAEQYIASFERLGGRAWVVEVMVQRRAA